ncbi:hypothetical protein Dimus_025031 [Dionaea muscipula]
MNCWRRQEYGTWQSSKDSLRKSQLNVSATSVSIGTGRTKLSRPWSSMEISQRNHSSRLSASRDSKACTNILLSIPKWNGIRSGSCPLLRASSSSHGELSSWKSVGFGSMRGTDGSTGQWIRAVLEPRSWSEVDKHSTDRFNVAAIMLMDLI